MKLGAIPSATPGESITLRYYRIRDEGDWDRWMNHDWMILVLLIPAYINVKDHFGFAYHRDGTRYTQFEQLPEPVQQLLLKEVSPPRKRKRQE